MNDQGSVTIWIAKLKEGDRDEATHRLWGTYFAKLVGLARNHLRTRPRGIADEEDVALGAFDSFVRAAEAGRFPELDDRNDLWQILLMLTSRKAIDLAQAESAQKRGSGKVVAISSLQAKDGDSNRAPDFEGAAPDPAEAIALAEGLEQMLGLLGDADLIRVALWSMEKYTNAEIAKKLDVAISTVERKLKRIREIYQRAGIGV